MKTLSLLALVLGATAVLLPSLASAAEPAAKQGDWLLLPGTLTGRRVVRAADAKPRVYRVVLEIPRTSDPASIRPRVTKSSGEPTIDELAWEFVRGSATRGGKLRDMLQKQTAVFQLELHAPSAETSSYRDTPPKRTEPANPDAAYYTPVPPYPYRARRLRDEGSAIVRVEWEAGRKRPSYVFMERSLGSPLLDTSTLQWAILYWERTSVGSAETKRIPITYKMRPRTGTRWW